MYRIIESEMMIIKNCSIKNLIDFSKDETIACFGVGNDLDNMLNVWEEFPWAEKISNLIDNDKEKDGKYKKIQGKNFEIKSLERTLKNWEEKTIILITCGAFYEIIKQLDNIDTLKDTNCYIYYFMANESIESEIPINRTGKCKIPPLIHYCWFGKGEKPELYKRCINSWKEKCPEYEVIEWNETNCNINDTAFTKEAYDEGKWGFVPDYFRLKIIYEYGGIYLDTDVEVLKNLDDLRREEAFCGLQLPGQVALGLGFGSVKNNPVIYNMMLRYEKMKFRNEDGTYNDTISPVYQTKDLVTMGMHYGNRYQKVDNLSIFPTEVLSPKNLYTGLTNITCNTYTNHHYDGSWIEKERYLKKIIRFDQAKEIESRINREDK